MNIMNLNDPEGYSHEFARPNYNGRMKAMGAKFGAKTLGFHLEIIDPKCFSAPYHWHTADEEIVLIIEGEGTVRVGGEFRKVKAGDLIHYPAGPEAVHHMYNHTDKPLKFFVLGNEGQNDNCRYPDSKKEMNEGEVTQNGTKVDYYKDEEDPKKYWPKEHL